MVLTIDRFGRIVLPKKLRSRLGLVPGSHLTVAEQDRGILLRPEAEALRRKKGVLLVFSGEPSEDLAEVCSRHRQQRLASLHLGISE